MQTKRKELHRAFALFVRRTHKKVRTLTCLAQKIVLASRLEHSNQTNNRRRWPSVPCFPPLTSGPYRKMELTPFRCSAPHSPSTLGPGKIAGVEGVAGTIARMLRRGGTGPCHASRAWALRIDYMFQCIANHWKALAALPAICRTHQPPPCSLHGNGFPIHAEPSNDTKRAAQGQARRRLIAGPAHRLISATGSLPSYIRPPMNSSDAWHNRISPHLIDSFLS